MYWFLKGFKQYFDFSGRARRREYWMFIVFYIVFYVGVLISDEILGTGSMSNGTGILSGIYTLVTFIPSLAVTVRRLHDTNRSGWYVLLGLIPVIGFIIILIFAVTDSEPGSNEYGPNPKEMML